MNNPRVRPKTATPFRDNGFRKILHPFWLKSAVLAGSSHRHCKLYVVLKSCDPPSGDCSVLKNLNENVAQQIVWRRASHTLATGTLLFISHVRTVGWGADFAVCRSHRRNCHTFGRRRITGFGTRAELIVLCSSKWRSA